MYVRRIAAAALPLAVGLTAAGPAHAADPGEATGPTGQKLTVSATENIDPAGQKVTVTGSGYALDQGIYLAVCAVPKAGEAPSPCLGGTDMSGTSGSSYWISNNPPDYAKDLVKPFTVQSDGKGGFSLELTIKAKDSSADCTQRACAVVTRADHTHSADRDQDVIVPVTFGAGSAPNPEVPAGTVRHQAVRTITPPLGGATDTEADPAAGHLHISTDSGSQSRLATYDTATGAVVGTPIELPAPATVMALDTGSGTLYLGLTNRIASYNTRTKVFSDNLAPVTGNIKYLAADPGADRLYVANQQGRSITVYSTENWQPVGEPVLLPFLPAGLAVDTKRHIGYATYVGGAMENGSLVYRNVLNAIDGSTGKLINSLSLGTTALGSMGVTVDSTSGTGYVANLAAGTVFTVDLQRNRVTGTLTVGANPRSLAYDAGTKTLYAAQTTAGTVAVVDPTKNKVTETLATGDGPDELTLDTERHTLFTVASGKVVQSQYQVSPTVTAAPKAVLVQAGKQAEFRAAAQGSPTPTAGWEVSTDEGRTWQPVAGAAGPKLSFKANSEHDGNRYRAVFSNPVGSIRSTAVELTVTPVPKPSPTDEPTDGPTDGPTDQPTDGPTDQPTGGLSGGNSGGSSGESSGGMDPGPDTTALSGGTTNGGGNSIGGGGSLASTGSTLLPLTIAAAALTALGAAAVALRRRTLA
ncbi:PT domain-containing protein [Streptomyces albipurpureus]|uniref:PT domain-containing protein n=1 Tax=Streptomyces albipurpureus TaxID=2897419 RepID=A0ABT0UN51_9ACTN|nr:PT domain-containing protein [Streptomyces sp. CWNU-1]MCM2390049.1 PT domain-containing protein [Streptomyces sp. CWNU-1]